MLKPVDTRREPTAVALLREALAVKLGRPAVSRPAKGDSVGWFVSDPSFAVLQRVSSGGRRDYRTGIAVYPNGIYFQSVYARAAAETLRMNLQQRPESLEMAATGTHELRSVHYLRYSSRKLARELGTRTKGNVFRYIEEKDWETFRKVLRTDAELIANDLFPDLPSSGRVGTGESLRGYSFTLLLAARRALAGKADNAQSIERVSSIINAAWHLFSCLYPWEPTAVRRADLRRAMMGRALGIRVCEYVHIVNAPYSPCDDSAVQAAHITPYALGGNDRAWNGLWLCGKHHRSTEGWLSGRRDPTNLARIRVRFGR